MNAQEQKSKCPVIIGQEYKGGKVIYICGDKSGWDVWTKREDECYRIESEVA